jgi:hypothetical protein
MDQMASEPRKPKRRSPLAAEPQLLYKVVELSTVDEAALERAVNHWVRRGWRLENVQFAMRESSKRPSMAFLFFTRQAAMGEEEALEAGSVDLAEESCVRPISPRERLSRLAGLDEE